MRWPWKRKNPDDLQRIADAISAYDVTIPDEMSVMIASKPGCPKCSSVGVVIIQSNMSGNEHWGRCLRCMHFWTI